MPALAERAKSTQVDEELEATDEVIENLIFDPRDPLDIPFSESGITPGIYYNPYHPGKTYYRHLRDEKGQVNGLIKLRIIGGRYHFNTPREEKEVQRHINQQLNGNGYERWMGDNLPPEAVFHCECGLICGNSLVAFDHRRKWKHQERIPD